MTVARKVEKETADKVREFKNEYKLKGVRLESDTKRYYPYSSLACHVIGFVGTDNYGLDGVEAQYDSALCGTSGNTCALPMPTAPIFCLTNTRATPVPKMALIL